MDKVTNKKLMKLAEQVLKDASWTCPLFKDRKSGLIYESYNGQVSALGVSILMIGLQPALAVYYQDTDKDNEAYRRGLLEVIARMLVLYKAKGYAKAEDMVREVLDANSNNELKTDILDCSVALKQVIRTYKLG